MGACCLQLSTFIKSVRFELIFGFIKVIGKSLLILAQHDKNTLGFHKQFQ